MALGNAVLTRTYRHLLKKAIEFDKDPALRYLICKRSPLLEEELCSVADAYLGGRDYYLPSPVLPQSVLEAARVACRFPPERSGGIDRALLGLRYLNSLSSIAAKYPQDHAQRHGGGPEPLDQHELGPAGQSQHPVTGPSRSKDHDMVESVEQTGGRQDGRDDSTAGHPVEQPVLETVAAPSRGCLLLAHPLLTGYWANAVVLLLSDSPSGGCSGLLLRPVGPSDATSPHQHSPRTGRVIIYPDGSTTFTEWAAESEDDSDEEEANEEGSGTLQEGPVTWAGGPIRGQALAEYTTHPAPGYTSSNFCVLPQMRGFWGLYRGYSSMQEDMQKSLPKGEWERMSQMSGRDWVSHHFGGESLWGPMQLEEEMASGYWICARPNGSYLTHLWCRAMPAIMRSQGSGQRSWGRRQLLWRTLLADVGGDVAAARCVTTKMAKEVMSE